MPPASHLPSPGILHNYTSRLVAFEHARPAATQQAPHNFILWIGGLGDGLLSVKYPKYISAALPERWGLAEVLLTSSYNGWTSGSLQRDAKELERAISYFRKQAAERGADSEKAQVILMGHSTGCQDTMEYMVGPRNSESIPGSTLDRPRVDGVILQAGVSDREGVVEVLGSEHVEKALDTARELEADGKGALPLAPSRTKSIFGADPSATRWISLVSRNGDDDYFSTDLEDAVVRRIWGSGGLATRSVRIMALLSEKDEHFTKHMDPQALLRKWKDAVEGGGGIWDQDSGVVKGATHNLNRASEDSVQELCSRVNGFVSRLQASSPDQSKI